MNTAAPILIALVLAYVVGAYMHKTKPRTREQYRRDLEIAERHHRETKAIRRLYVRATCEQIMKELRNA